MTDLYEIAVNSHRDPPNPIWLPADEDIYLAWDGPKRVAVGVNTCGCGLAATIGITPANKVQPWTYLCRNCYRR